MTGGMASNFGSYEMFEFVIYTGKLRIFLIVTMQYLDSDSFEVKICNNCSNLLTLHLPTSVDEVLSVYKCRMTIQINDICLLCN